MRFALTAVVCLSMASPASEMRGMKHPALSPDGKRLAFSWHGDVWVCPAEGGAAERVTEDTADEQAPAWSPDGASIAFSTDKNGNRDVYVIELGSRRIRQLTFHSSDDDRPAWSPDGKSIAFQSTRDSNVDLCLNNDVWDVWRVPSTGGTATRVTRFRGENPAWSPDGKQIAYDRYSWGYADGEHNLFVIASDGSGMPREIASGEEDSRRPTWQGTSIYFGHEANGFHRSASRNVWKTGEKGGALVQLTGLRGDHVTWPTTCAATDALVFEYDFDFYSINVKARAPAVPVKLKITAESPYRDDPKATRAVSAGLRQPSWSPDGASVVCVAGPWGGAGHVVRVAMDGKCTMVTKEPAMYRSPALSPNGRTVAVQVDEAGEKGIAFIDASSGARRVFADEKGVEEGWPSWSPDSKRVAYLKSVADPTMRTEIVDKDVTGAGRVVETNRSWKAGLSWSPDGKTLAFGYTEGPGGAWSIATVPAAGGKVAWVPTESGIVRQAPSWSPDSSMILCEEGRVNRGTPQEGREQLWIRDAGAPATKLQVKYLLDKPVSRREEMTALFVQVWNAYDRNYYDPFFHGVDWAAMREKYRPFASESQTKAEVYELINDLIRELRSSHVHLTPAPMKSAVLTGFIGADLEPGFKLVRVEPNGPAARAGLKDGDALLKVGVTELGSSSDVDRLLSAEAAEGLKEVALQVKRGDETVDVVLKPITRTELRSLKYENQVARAKALVKEKSEGRLGYHHIKMMMMPEVTRLKAALEKEYSECQALVLDIRDGVGGMSHKQVIHQLDSTAPDRINANPAGVIRYRNGSTQADKYGNGTQGGRITGKSFDRPVIMIQNEVSRSDKEILPWTFRHAGVGYRVGMPTAGGVIGGNDWALKDGSRITVSAQGWFTSDGRNLEGWGVPPDYRVPLTHEDYYAGRDPQLEKAVEVLMGQLEGKVPAPRVEKK